MGLSNLHIVFVRRSLLLLMVSLLLCQCIKDGEDQAPNTQSSSNTYDIDKLGIPKLVFTDYTVLDSVQRISRFRSGVGHDYSDGFENCRSMKHYYPVAKGTPIYSPISGTVNFLLQEWSGHKVQIIHKDEPAFYFELFHVELSIPLQVGDTLVAGQMIGTHSSNNTMSDIGVLVNVPNDSNAVGRDFRFISYFDVMSDQVFQNYTSRGVSHRDSLIITKGERDADPLDCNASWGVDPGVGNIVNWVDLQ